ncbi:MAG: phosphotriesterase-related protein [Chloroflexi bacterium]|nr:phosphotriesterase-related protein [Chloroflexota bacterium]
MSDQATGKVMTVKGPIEGERLGLTLMHEHIFIRLWEVSGRFDAAGIVDDEDLLTNELMSFKRHGGASVVDLTLTDIGRQPARLKAMSERTGLNIVMGCGWYRQPYYRPEANIDRRTVDDLARELIGEVENGVGETGIRPGIIGEIGADKTWISAQEERVHRAAARAQIATGLAINTHAVKGGAGLAQLRIFEDEGADLSRVIIGHADSYPLLDYLLAIADKGATIAFDNISGDNEGRYRMTLNLAVGLVKRGYAGQLVLSHDVCYDSHLAFYGGRGYAYLTSTFLPALGEAGVTQEAIRQMTVENPRRLLTRV